MLVDTTIYGYVTDGGAYHPQCTDRRPDGDHDDVSALLSIHDDDVHGLTCDQCGEYIFEPSEAHTFRPVPAGSSDDGTCWDCGEDADDWLHNVATD